MCLFFSRLLFLSFFPQGVSSTSHLLSKSLLRAAVWSISCVTCLGNSLVLWGRFTAKDENRVLSIVIRNLAGNYANMFLDEKFDEEVKSFYFHSSKSEETK